MSRLIILDRDGVINQDSDHYIKTIDEFIPIPGSLEAIAQLCQAGYTVVVATNQSGIARNYFSLETLQAMHQKLQDLLEPLGGRIAHFYYCPHGPDEQCDCRKPKPGMILQIAHDFLNMKQQGINEQQQLSDVYLVGDSIRDLEAGIAAGTRIALVKTGKGMRSLEKITRDKLSDYAELPLYSDLADFTQQLLSLPTKTTRKD